MLSVPVDTLGFRVQRYPDLGILCYKKTTYDYHHVIKEGMFYLNIKKILKRRYFKNKDFWKDSISINGNF